MHCPNRYCHLTFICIDIMKLFRYKLFDVLDDSEIIHIKKILHLGRTNENRKEVWGSRQIAAIILRANAPNIKHVVLENNKINQ